MTHLPLRATQEEVAVALNRIGKKQTLLTVRCASAMEDKFAVGQDSPRENHSYRSARAGDGTEIGSALLQLARIRGPHGPFLLPKFKKSQTISSKGPVGASYDQFDDRSGDGRPGVAGPGSRNHFRLSGRRGPADLRRPIPPRFHQALAGASRTGGGACRRGLRPVERQGWGAIGDLWSWRHQCGYRLDRCVDGFDPAHLYYRPGANPSHRLRRLPGMRYGRHNPALHQA